MVLARRSLLSPPSCRFRIHFLFFITKNIINSPRSWTILLPSLATLCVYPKAGTIKLHSNGEIVALSPSSDTWNPILGVISRTSTLSLSFIMRETALSASSWENLLLVLAILSVRYRFGLFESWREISHDFRLHQKSLMRPFLDFGPPGSDSNLYCYPRHGIFCSPPGYPVYRLKIEVCHKDFKIGSWCFV